EDGDQKHVYIALYRSGNGVRQHLNGEPDALKGARPVRGGEAGK
ncbi:reverse transcriptase family domain protein, partial [Escherichia coli 2-474-04_S3_C3]